MLCELEIKPSSRWVLFRVHRDSIKPSSATRLILNCSVRGRCEEIEMTNAINNTAVNSQVEAIEKYLAELELKEVYVHELFGFDSPVKGFEEPIDIPEVGS